MNIRILPGSLLPSIGREKATIAHETVANVVHKVMVSSDLNIEFCILQDDTDVVIHTFI